MPGGGAVNTGGEWREVEAGRERWRQGCKAGSTTQHTTTGFNSAVGSLGARAVVTPTLRPIHLCHTQTHTHCLINPHLLPCSVMSPADSSRSCILSALLPCRRECVFVCDAQQYTAHSTSTQLH